MNTGASSSVTVMVWVRTLVLPQPSIAVNFRSITNELGQLPKTVSTSRVTVTAEQLSVAVASSKVSTSEHEAL